MLLFSGYVIPYADIPVFFRWIYYVSIFQWAFTILRINQFHDLDFADGGTGDMSHGGRDIWPSLERVGKFAEKLPQFFRFTLKTLKDDDIRHR